MCHQTFWKVQTLEGHKRFRVKSSHSSITRGVCSGEFGRAYLIRTATWISVWCFFAVVLSSVVWWYFRFTREGVACALAC